MSGTMIKKFQGLVSFYFPVIGDFAMTGLPVLLLGGADRINVIFMMKKQTKHGKNTGNLTLIECGNPVQF